VAAAALQGAFPGTWAIVTGGADGSAAAGPADTLSVAGRSVEVVDATGAGDAYLAGLIAALLDEPWPPAADAMQRAMDAATEVGAQVAGVFGAQGLP
jgi:fructokinase